MAKAHHKPYNTIGKLPIVQVPESSIGTPALALRIMFKYSLLLGSAPKCLTPARHPRRHRGTTAAMAAASRPASRLFGCGLFWGSKVLLLCSGLLQALVTYLFLEGRIWHFALASHVVLVKYYTLIVPLSCQNTGARTSTELTRSSLANCRQTSILIRSIQHTSSHAQIFSRVLVPDRP